MNNYLTYTGFTILITILIVAAVKEWMNRNNRYQSSLTTQTDPNELNGAPDDGVNDPQVAAELFRQIQRDMAETFGFLPSRPVCALLMTGSEIIRRMRRSPEQNPFEGIAGVENEQLVLFVRSGLPIGHFYATLAHEYAHLWQILEGFSCNDIERCEGFAEWVALVLTRKAGFNVEELFSRSPGDPYGIGMRRFAALEALYGPRKAAQLAKKSGFDLRFLRADYDCFQSAHTERSSESNGVWHTDRGSHREFPVTTLIA